MSQDIDVSIVPVNDLPSTGGFQLLGEAYAFEAVDAEGNPVKDFGEMLTLTFQFNPDDLNRFDEDSLMIRYWDDTLSSPSWVDLPSIVDTAKHTVTAETDHFTLFGIFGILIPEPGTFMLLGLGLLGLLALVRRRRKMRK